MSKGLKIVIVSVSAIMLCAIVLVAALMFGKNGVNDGAVQDQLPKRDDVNLPFGSDTDNSGNDKVNVPGENPDKDEADTATISVWSAGIADYPLVDLYCVVKDENGGDITGLAAGDILIYEGRQGANTAQREVISAADMGTGLYECPSNLVRITYRSADDIATYDDRIINIVLDSSKYLGSDDEDIRFEEEPEEEPLKKDSSYLVVRGDYTWQQAYDYCKQQGGHLVTFDSEEEYNQVLRLVGKEDKIKVFWAGARINDINDSWNSAQWVTGKDITFTDWYPGEPNKEEAGEMYLMVFSVNGEWSYNDAPNDVSKYYSGKIGFVCEFED